MTLKSRVFPYLVHNISKVTKSNYFIKTKNDFSKNLNDFLFSNHCYVHRILIYSLSEDFYERKFLNTEKICIM